MADSTSSLTLGQLHNILQSNAKFLDDALTKVTDPGIRGSIEALAIDLQDSLAGLPGMRALAGLARQENEVHVARQVSLTAEQAREVFEKGRVEVPGEIRPVAPLTSTETGSILDRIEQPNVREVCQLWFPDLLNVPTRDWTLLDAVAVLGKVETYEWRCSSEGQAKLTEAMRVCQRYDNDEWLKQLDAAASAENYARFVDEVLAGDWPPATSLHPTRLGTDPQQILPQPPSVPPATSKSSEQTSPVARAIALLLDAERNHRNITVKDLALAVGTNRTALYRDLLFKAALTAFKENRRTIVPRGHKDGEGNMDAQAG